jgi:hypothetical protein
MVCASSCRSPSLSIHLSSGSSDFGGSSDFKQLHEVLTLIVLSSLTTRKYEQ